jgi:hypothetical protein
MFKLFSITLVTLIANTALGVTQTTLNFNAASPGTINDANGVGTGFTNRLPGTGSAIGSNDANLSLSANPGQLSVTSNQGNLAQDGPLPRNLPTLEAPGLFFPGVGNKDLIVTASFDNVNVPNASDQLLIYVGVNENKVVRAGFHDGEQYTFIDNSTGVDAGGGTAVGSFAPGDNIDLTLTRTAGLWSLAWVNLTTPANSGAIGPFSIPWSENDLYIGIHAANALSATTFVGIVDNFSVTIVPEPSAVSLCGIAGLALAAKRRKRFRSTSS